MSPVTGQAAPNSPFAMMGGGADEGGPDQVQQQLSDLMGQIRDLASQVDQIAQENPALAQEVQSIRAILKQMIVKSAQQAPGQTGSSLAVPMAGM